MTYVPVWVPYPDLGTVCVLDLAHWVIKASGLDLKLKKVVWGAYKEIDDETLRHILVLETIDCKGDIAIYGAEVLVEVKDGKKVKTLIFFEIVRQDPTDPSIIWRKICDFDEVNVEENAKFAVDAHNSKNDDNLIYISTVGGWFYHVSPNAIRYELFIQAKDCFGRVRIYRAVVLEENHPNEKIRTLEYFKITPRKC